VLGPASPAGEVAADPGGDAALHLYRGAKAGWFIVRDGRVAASGTDMAKFDAALRREARAALVRSLDAAALIPARIRTIDGRRRLELFETDAPEPANEIPLLLVPMSAGATGRASPTRAVPTSTATTKALGIEVVSAGELRFDELVIREWPEPDSARPPKDLSPSHALWRLLSSPLAIGRDRAATLDGLAALLAGCRRCTSLRRRRRAKGSSDGRPQDGPIRLLARPAARGPAPLVDRRPRLAGGLRQFQIGDEWIAIDPERAAPVLLDAQAKSVLDLLDGETSLQEIADVAAELLRGRRRTIERRLAALADRFERHGLARAAPSPVAATATG
jgi:hypothetical protein